VFDRDLWKKRKDGDLRVWDKRFLNQFAFDKCKLIFGPDKNSCHNDPFKICDKLRFFGYGINQ